MKLNTQIVLMTERELPLYLIKYAHKFSTKSVFKRTKDC